MQKHDAVCKLYGRLNPYHLNPGKRIIPDLTSDEFTHLAHTRDLTALSGDRQCENNQIQRSVEDVLPEVKFSEDVVTGQHFVPNPAVQLPEG